MKIVLTDIITITNGEDDLSLKPLHSLGSITSYPLTDYEEIPERISDAEAVICNKTKLDSHSLANAKIEVYRTVGYRPRQYRYSVL